MPAKNIRVKSFKTDPKKGEVVATVTATGIHPNTRKPSAKIMLEVRIPTIPGEHPRTTSKRAKDDALLYLELRDSFG